VFNTNMDAANLSVMGNHAKRGGGISLNTATLTVSSSSILDNTAVVWGGGIRTRSSRLTLVASSASGNTAEWNGGGLFAEPSSITLHQLQLRALCYPDLDLDFESMFKN